ncbi:MAG: hypothetical protein WBA45_04660 [Microthrixaceae bacterium]
MEGLGNANIELARETPVGDRLRDRFAVRFQVGDDVGDEINQALKRLGLVGRVVEIVDGLIAWRDDPAERSFDRRVGSPTMMARSSR